MLRHFTPEPSLRKLKYYLLYRKKHRSIRFVLGASPFEGDDKQLITFFKSLPSF